mgnify:CR=1 FL=1
MVFVDGDFWHGWRFPLWKGKLTPSWQEKIEATKVLMKLRQVQEKNKALFDKLGLDHSGHPKKDLA